MSALGFGAARRACAFGAGSVSAQQTSAAQETSPQQTMDNGTTQSAQQAQPATQTSQTQTGQTQTGQTDYGQGQPGAGDSASGAAVSAPATPGNDVPDSTPGTPRTENATDARDRDRIAEANRASTGQRPEDNDAVLWMVIPVELQSRSDQMSQGCWVQLFSRDNFEGRYLTVVGPANIAEVASPYGTGMNNWDSAIVGPRATVTTYDGENYRSRSATLRAGHRQATRRPRR